MDRLTLIAKAVMLHQSDLSSGRSTLDDAEQLDLLLLFIEYQIRQIRKAAPTSANTTVIIEFENRLDSSEQEIRYTLMDALGEFQSHRHHDGASYVQKRYPGNDVYSGERREEKIRQVNRRIFLAEQMRNANKTVL